LVFLKLYVESKAPGLVPASQGKRYSIVTYSVTVSNSSGASQKVAIFLAGTSSASGYSLVWLLNTINDQGNYQFKWDETAYGLGWGTTTQPIDAGMQFQVGQATPVSPNTSGGKNVLPIGYQNGSFSSGATYFDIGVSGKLEIDTDTSFTVSNALTMSVALYMASIPALVVQGAPNTQYLFDITQFSYYLTVTNSALGVALPRSNAKFVAKAPMVVDSMTTPTEIAFGPGATSLKYNLTNTLIFQPML
jgi:hypothetical protein